MTPQRILSVENFPDAYKLEVKLNEDEILRMSIKHAQEEKSRNRKGSLILKYDRATVARAARMYNSTVDASTALGMKDKGSSFTRLCKQYGIETPAERKKRLKAVMATA